MASILLVFAVVAGIVVLGFVGELLFRRTGIPSFLYLILMGILLGPVFQVFSGLQLLPVLGLFAELTLVMILFYSGLGMKLGSLVRGGGRAVLLVFLYVPIAIVVIGLLGYYLAGWDILQSFIFASIIGGQTSTAVVVPLAKSLKLTEDTVTFVTIESVMNSIVGIVVFLALIQAYTLGTMSWTAAVTQIAASFSVGIVPAAFLSVAWVLLLDRVKDQKYTYVFTLGLLLGTYSVTTVLGGSGELGVFVFGLIFGNYTILNRIRKKKISMEAIMSRLSDFQDEISFLLNTLFFVFLGLTFQLEFSHVVSQLALASVFVILLMVSRFVSVSISTARSDLRRERREITLLSAQGVTQATLAIIALNRGIPLATTFLALAAYVIILTNIITTAGSIWAKRRAQHVQQLEQPASQADLGASL
jgi:cell volume regulation protein A